MGREKRIVVECNPDEVLVKALGITAKQVAHQNDKGEVCNYMRKTEVKLALIDEDPYSGQPKYLSEFETMEDKFNVRKLFHTKDKKTILVLKPRLEEWIIEQCKVSGIVPKHLPNNAQELKKVINLRLNFFGDLVSELLQSKNPGLAYLKNEMLPK